MLCSNNIFRGRKDFEKVFWLFVFECTVVLLIVIPFLNIFLISNFKGNQDDLSRKEKPFTKKSHLLPIFPYYPLEMLQKLLSCDVELLKAPYMFDMVNAKESADERDIEKLLVEHITKYLLEMGNGFDFVAGQKHFQVGSSDFYADLILYNIKLHTYIVVELKATPFKSQYAGLLNFYINVVDDQMRGGNDGKTDCYCAGERMNWWCNMP